MFHGNILHLGGV